MFAPLGRFPVVSFRKQVTASEALVSPPWSSPMLRSGVGKYPNPVAEMWGTKGGRWNATPLRIVPCLGQVSENSTKPPSKQA